MVKNFKRNKHGWIEIVEAFIAVLLVAGVLLIVINKYSPSSQDVSERVYNVEISIIREIQLNEAMRTEIAGVTVPKAWEDFPADVKALIISRTPNYLECVAKLCDTSDTCYLTAYSSKDTYAQAGIISSGNSQQYPNPVQLKLFCWAK